MKDLKMYEIVISPHFERQVKPLMRKNISLKDHLKAVLSRFNKLNAVSLGKGVYKIRIQGQNRGKSRGYRLYIYIVEIDKRLSPIAIYAKNQKDDLSFEEISFHLNKVKNEIKLSSSK